MGMDACYLEISPSTLEAVMKDKSLLHTIIYEKKDMVLNSLDLVIYDAAAEINDIFFTLLKTVAETGEIDSLRFDDTRLLWYDEFPGYGIYYHNHKEVNNIWEYLSRFLKKTKREDINPNYFVRHGWYDGFVEYYKSAAQRGSAQLYCIT